MTGMKKFLHKNLHKLEPSPEFKQTLQGKYRKQCLNLGMNIQEGKKEGKKNKNTEANLPKEINLNKET